MFSLRAALVAGLLPLATLAAFHSNNTACTHTYTVVAGDTCDTIGQKTLTSTFQILALNLLEAGSSCYTLEIGKQLCLGRFGNDCQFVHRCVSGDTCASIASQYGISESLLRDNNPILDCDVVYDGLMLCVAPGSIRPPADNSINSTMIRIQREEAQRKQAQMKIQEALEQQQREEEQESDQAQGQVQGQSRGHTQGESSGRSASQPRKKSTDDSKHSHKSQGQSREGAHSSSTEASAGHGPHKSGKSSSTSPDRQSHPKSTKSEQQGAGAKAKDDATSHAKTSAESASSHHYEDGEAADKGRGTSRPDSSSDGHVRLSAEKAKGTEGEQATYSSHDGATSPSQSGSHSAPPGLHYDADGKLIPCEAKSDPSGDTTTADAQMAPNGTISSMPQTAANAVHHHRTSHHRKRSTHASLSSRS